MGQSENFSDWKTQKAVANYTFFITVTCPLQCARHIFFTRSVIKCNIFTHGGNLKHCLLETPSADGASDKSLLLSIAV